MEGFVSGEAYYQICQGKSRVRRSGHGEETDRAQQCAKSVVSNQCIALYGADSGAPGYSGELPFMRRKLVDAYGDKDDTV